MGYSAFNLLNILLVCLLFLFFLFCFVFVFASVFLFRIEIMCLNCAHFLDYTCRYIMNTNFHAKNKPEKKMVENVVKHIYSQPVTH